MRNEDPPEIIYLIPDDNYEDGGHNHIWCEDPAPGIGMDADDSVAYYRADVIPPAVQQVIEAAKDVCSNPHLREYVPPGLRERFDQALAALEGDE